MKMQESTNWQALNAKGNQLWEGSEADVKQFVETQFPRADLSVVAPDGTEFVFEGGTWVLV